jgi:hypothetical protein
MRRGVVYTTNFVTPADLSYGGLTREPELGERVKLAQMPSGTPGFIAWRGQSFEMVSVPDGAELRCPTGELHYWAHGVDFRKIHTDFAALRYVKPLFRRGEFFLNWFERGSWARSQIPLRFVHRGHPFLVEP